MAPKNNFERRLQFLKKKTNKTLSKSTITYLSNLKPAWSVDHKAGENSSNYLLSLSKVIIYFLLFKKPTISEDEGYFLAVIITSWLIYSGNQKHYTGIFFPLDGFHPLLSSSI